ncbi:uncharacterized protein [Gossypium hirsutum]|uniref:Uncharacterized protein isoform X2 n=1 Tax=Gossypium hirsutum TaxID=3635 RepID=A0ABM3BCI1_GOSHI|nr:uncharacterized protein LOC107903854 isoform X2 [Gossypium hirsutum]
MGMKTPMINSAAEKIAYNQDLLTQILLRLPTKSLIKFKSVSKLWQFIISDPDFCLSHTRHHHRNGFLSPTALLLKGDRFSPPSEFSIVPLKHYRLFASGKVIGSLVSLIWTYIHQKLVHGICV